MTIPNLATLTHRDDFGVWLNESKLTGEGAEIGCAYGAYSATILSRWRGQRLYMIDPWSKRPDGEYLEEANHTANFDAWYEDCRKLAAAYTIVCLVRMPSLEGVNLLPDGRLDWAYLDGAHDYRNVLADLDAWWPKIKVGGVLGGHDWYNSTQPPSYCEVKDAVKRWCREHKRSFTVTPCSSWWMIKTQ